MSLRVDGQLTTLAGAIYDWLQARQSTNPMPADPTAAETEAKERLKKLMDQVCEYLITYMKIKGIKVELDSGTTTVETYAVGVGDHGGALNASAYPVVGSVKLAKDTNGSQKSADETTGHVE